MSANPQPTGPPSADAAASTIQSSAATEGNPIEPGAIPPVDASGLQQDQYRKIDPITAVQDAIDGLSLAMFEALRGLRDAVAPESGNLFVNANNPNANNNQENNNASEQNDVEDLWHAYCSNDPDVVEQIEPYTKGRPIQKREEFMKLHALMEHDKDAKLVEKVASEVLEKSRQIDLAVDDLGDSTSEESGEEQETKKSKKKKRKQIPGMHRTRQQQMEYIEKLIQDNAEATAELEKVYETARQRRDSCRVFIKQQTAYALGIEEDGD